MAMRLETPSRILARIERAQDVELPSLPSMPEFEDSAFPDQSEAVSAFYPTPAKHKSPSVFTPTPRPNKIRALSTPRSLGESTARAPVPPDDSRSSPEISIHSLPDEYLPPPTQDDVELSMSLTDALESVSRSESPDGGPAPVHKSLKDIYNDSHVSVRDADATRRSNHLSAHVKPSPRARIPAQAPSPIPTLTHSPRSVTSASSQHTPTLQRLPLSPAQGDTSYGSASDRSRNSVLAPRPTSRVESERDISYDSLSKDSNQEHSHHSRHASERSLAQSRMSARPSPKASSAAAPLASDSEITYDSVTTSSLARSRSSPGQQATSGAPRQAPVAAPLDPHRRSLTQSPTSTTTQPRARFPVPQTPGSGLDGSAPPTPIPASGKISRSFMMQYVNSAMKPNLLPKATPFAHGRFQTPATRHLFEGAGGSSFVSTASSHDLAIHRRANTSFDPILHARGGGGEFDQIKLRSYLWSLNKHLTDENIDYEKQNTALKKACLGLIERLAARGIRVDREALLGDGFSIDWAVDGVEQDFEIPYVQDVSEQLVDALNDAEAAREEAQAAQAECDAAQAEASAAREEAARAKEESDVRMAELEDTAFKEVGRLKGQLKEREAEASKLREQLVERSRDGHIEHEEAMAVERERVAQLENEVGRLEEEIAKLEAEGKKLKTDLKDARSTLRSEQIGAAETVDQARSWENEVRNLKRNIQAMERELEEMDVLEKERDEAVTERDTAIQERNEIARERDAAIQEQKDILDERDRLFHQRDNALKQVERMEAELEDVEAKLLDEADEVKSLRGKVTSLERERAELLERSSRARLEIEDRVPLHEHEAQLADLERQLDDARREIARLTTEPPAGVALAKDIKIERLEKEKGELVERIQAMRSAGFGPGAGTPGRVSFAGTSAHGTPLNRLAMMNLRTPKTPGAALKDPSWMNQSTMHGLAEPEAIHARLLELDARLAEANESVDDKFDELQKASIGAVALSKDLYLSKEKITSLERELARLGRREESLIKKLQRCRCTKCHKRFDASVITQWAETSSPSLLDDLVTEPPTPETKTSRNLQSALATANTQLDDLRAEWQKLEQENVVLRDAGRQEVELARQAEAAMKHAMKEERRKAIEAAKGIKDVNEREKALANMELDRARNAIEGLEENLRAERSKLRSLTAEHLRANREKDQVLARLEKTNQDVDSVKAQLEKYKNSNKELEMELQSNTIADTKAHDLEVKLQENNVQIENLRSEREVLARDHEQLRRRFEEVTERADSLRQRNANSQAEHENRQHRLDMQVTEIETLRAMLAERETGMRDMVAAAHVARGAKTDAEHVVLSLQAELARVKSESDRLAADVKKLRSERIKDGGRDKSEQDRTRAQIRGLDEKVESAQSAVGQLHARLKQYDAVLKPEQIENLKKTHNKECKGLMVQIRYLKDKFGRESVLRQDLSYQKKYLIKILDVYSKPDESIESALARPGFPHEQQPTKTKKSLKSVASAALFMVRARRLGADWRQKRRVKPAISAALEEVRRNRVVPGRA